jgi:hypothetical protein
MADAHEQFGGITPAFPAQWLDGLYEFAPVSGFLCHRDPWEAFASFET